MLPLLVLVGAIVMYTAGWLAAGRLKSNFTSATPPEEPPTIVGPVDVIDRHPTGVVVCAATGAIEYRNEAAQALAGTHTAVLIDEAIDKHLRSARSGTPTAEVLEFFGPPKRVVSVSTQTLPGGRAVAFVDDITDQRRADQMRTDFVANVSHELRTPIGALMVLAETLVDATEPDVVNRIAARIQGEAERASGTIDELLELSQIEAATDREFEAVRLLDVVNDASTRASALAEHNDIRLSTGESRRGDLHSALVVRGDRRQLASAVGNVVENAVKYSDPGGHVQVTVRESEGFGEITVTDDGPGIPKGDLDRIFERFYRVDRARSRNSGGTGLGLAIVRHVLQNHAGTVAVESSEGEGSTFVLRIPLIASDPPAVDSGLEQEGVP